LKRYRKQEDWSLSDEREFLETLYNQRINFFILAYSLTITGVLSASSPIEKVLVLVAGLSITVLLGLSLYRACHKLLLLLAVLHRTRQHPVRYSGKLASRYNWPLSVRVNHLTGIALPLICSLVLLIWLVVVIIQNAPSFYEWYLVTFPSIK